MENTVYKAGDTVPAAGKYVCSVCGFIIEYLEKHLVYGVKFPACPVCMKGEHEDVWVKVM